VAALLPNNFYYYYIKQINEGLPAIVLKNKERLAKKELFSDNIMPDNKKGH